MIIAITGTPGTGKTTLAKKISKLGLKYLDGKRIGKRIAECYDKKSESYIVDERLFAKEVVAALQQLKKKKVDYVKLKAILGSEVKLSEKSVDAVIDSHLSHYLPKKAVDLVIVVRCDIGTLRKRLAKRKYAKEKIEENIEAEIMDVCGMEAKDAGHRVLYVND